MKKIFNIEREKHGFSFFLAVSFAIHIFLSVLFLSSSHFWDFFRKDKKIISPVSIRVDMVGLPDLPSKKEITKEKKEKPVLLPKKPKELKKKEKQKHRSQDPKKTKESKKKKQTETQKKKKTSPDSEKEITKGNRLSEGAKKGEEILSSQQMSDINAYMMVVKEKITANWNLPSYLTDIRLTAQIEIRINNQGEMIYKQIVLSSGNELFDSYVLKAIENAAPYLPPPASVRNLIQDGIIFNLDSRL